MLCACSLLFVSVAIGLVLLPRTAPCAEPADAAIIARSHTRQSGAEPIRIAVALPLSGPRRALGAAVRERLDRLVADIEAHGGRAGRPIDLEIHDDACSREAAAELAHRLIATQPLPVVVIGHPCGVAAITAAPIYQQAGILFIAAGTRHPKLTEERAGPLVLRAAGRDDRQGMEAGLRLRGLAGESGATTIVHDRTVMARTLATAARTALATANAPAPIELPMVAGEADYSRIVTAIAAANPAAVLFLGFPAEAAILLRQLRQAGIGAPVLTNDAMATREFVDHAGDLLSSHVEVMLPVSIDPTGHAEAETADGLAASDTAAALTLWTAAVAATGSDEPARIAEHLRTGPQGPYGITFDQKGDAQMPSYAPFRYIGGAWQQAGGSVDARNPPAAHATGAAH